MPKPRPKPRPKPKIKSVGEEERNRAWRAVKEFRRLASSLNTYARAVTGNKNVRIVATDGMTETDGTTMWIQPPIELGDMTPHDKALCGKRGGNKRQMCRACDIREMSLASIFHEIAHIVFGSRVYPNTEGITAIRDIVNEWHPKDACDHAQIIFDSWQPNYFYLDLAAKFGDVLAIMINALEDARVNAAQFRARPGTRVMMEINLRRVFEDGVAELNLGEFAFDDDQLKWQDRSLAEQLMVGIFLEASEYYDITDDLDARVGRILREPRMAESLSKIATAEDAHRLVVAACDVFRQLVDVGALDIPRCEPPLPPEPMPPMPGSGGEESDETDQEREPEEESEGDSSGDHGDSDNEDQSNEDPEDSDDSNSPPDEDAGGEFGKSEQGTAQPKEQSKGEKDDTGTGQPGDSTTGKEDTGDGTEGEETGEPEVSDTGDTGGADETPNGENSQQEGGSDEQDLPGSGPDDDNQDGEDSDSAEPGDKAEGDSDAVRDDEQGTEGGDSQSESGDSTSSGGAEGAEGEGDDDGVSGETGTEEESGGTGDGSGEDSPGQADCSGIDKEEAGGESDSTTEEEVDSSGGEEELSDTTREDSPGEGDAEGDVLEGEGTEGSSPGPDGEANEPGAAPEGGTPEDDDSVDGDADPGSGKKGESSDSSDAEAAGKTDRLDEEAAEESEEVGDEDSDEDPDYSPTEQDGETEYEAAPVPSGSEGGDDKEPIAAISREELVDALKAITLHNVLSPHDNFATGEDVGIGHSDIDPAHNHFGIPDHILEAISLAINQAAYFDTSSKNVETVEIIEHGNRDRKWISRPWEPSAFKPAEGSISKSVHEARVLFDANARGRRQGNLKAGKVDGRNLAKRIPQQDARMFRKNILPKRESYEVFITADISGSTMSEDRISRIKRAVYGQAEMLHRVGVPFELWAHSAGWVDPTGDLTRMSLWMYHIKKSGDPWNQAAKKRLSDLRPVAGNLDGHTLEFIRKRAQLSRATKKIIVYYTDGAMPASNYYEELEILRREIKICQREGIALLAVGIDTDSPEEHGFRTCQVNSDTDLPKVVKMLKEQMVA